MPMTPREMIKHLKQNGFEIVSQNGSHIKMKNSKTNLQTIIPYHSKSLKKGLGATNFKTGRAEISPLPLFIGGFAMKKIILSCYIS